MTDDERDTWLEAYRAMSRIRRFEETVAKLMRQGRLPGFVHLYIGEEASAVGVCGALEPGDMVFSNHRPHGHCLACGTEPAKLLAELYGHREGVCRGRAGSMHIADIQNGFFGANGIVGAGIVLALGPALRAQLRGTTEVSVAFFGDGASNQGAFHEALNLAGVWKLPVLFVCENDGYAQATPRAFHQAVERVADRARAYGVHGAQVDGQDVRAVRTAAQTALSRARAGEGATLLECATVRYCGHYEGDPLNYKSETELAEGDARDPLQLHRNVLASEFGVSDAELDAIQRAVDADILEAVEIAEQGTAPEPADAFDHVLT